MKLIILIGILLSGGLLSWIAGKINRKIPRWVSLVTLGVYVVVVTEILVAHRNPTGTWWTVCRVSWIPAFGISVHLAVDGLSWLLLAITGILGFLSVILAWKEDPANPGFYHFNLLWILAGITGVFLSLDLFLFYFFWELMLIPMYLLINIWGHENRIKASYKFFLYTQSGGLLMLISIIMLYWIHGNETGIYSFDLADLLGTYMSPYLAILVMAGFLAAFLVKLPIVPLHNWLPDAHAEAPTAGSVILAGLLLKTGAYGILRFVIPLFPKAVNLFAPIGIWLGVIGIIYGAKLAFSQTDLKRLIAYTSVSHMGFVMLGIFSLNMVAWQGVVIQMLAHALSTGALFILAGQLYERIHTRDMLRMGGLWDQLPVMGGMWLVFAMASLGLPGMGNFVAEFLVLAGGFSTSVVPACVATAALVVVTVYALRMVQKVMLGSGNTAFNLRDLSLREKAICAVLVLLLLYLGLVPGHVLDLAFPTIHNALGNMQRFSMIPALIK